MIAKRLLHQAVLRGHTALFKVASDMLTTRLLRTVLHSSHATILCVVQVGYLPYGARYVDLLFEVITRRYQL
jgi:hypothetical protein